jgi:ATP synthase protein I
MSQRPEDKSDAPAQGAMADFGRRLHDARVEAGLETKPSEGPAPVSLAGYALRLATELVAGVLVGAFIGWWIDKRFGTSPFGLLVCFILGAAAGGWNIVRAVKRMNALNAANAPPRSAADDDDDDEDWKKD